MKQSILDLIEISTYAGARADYTQGGGGNTSVKDESGVMLIKASGYKLIDINQTTAFVGVDQKAIFNYYANVDVTQDKDFEKESAEVSKNSIVNLEGIKTLRPSVEVGFHSILKKYVIHTHSVYANIITCSIEGEELANKLFSNKDFGYIFLPYINPGFELTLAMKKKIEEYKAQTGKYPEVIFMKNHGLVVNADSVERVKDVHTRVNETIRDYFKLSEDFTKVDLVEENGGFKSNTKITLKLLDKLNFKPSLLDEYPLYPDQLVYLNALIKNAPETISIDNKGAWYKAEKSKATTLEETLAAYLFVTSTILDNGLTISTMNEKEVAFINGWEAEKYRSSVK